MTVARVVLCRLLNTHSGPIESGLVEHESSDTGPFTVRFVRCSRCGNVVPLDMEPRHETEYRIFTQ